MIVQKKQLIGYLGVSYKTARKHYQTYLDILETKRKYLTVNDLAKIDDMSKSEVLERLGISNKKR